MPGSAAKNAAGALDEEGCALGKRRVPLLIVSRFQAGRPACLPLVKRMRSADTSPRAAILVTLRQTVALEQPQPAATVA